MAMRVVAVARDVELWARQAGWPAAVDVLGHRRGHAYDPAVVDAFVADGERWLAAIGDDPCAAVLDAEPAPVLWIGADELDGALAAVADFADLKSPCLRGHSTGVAALAPRRRRPRAWPMPMRSRWVGPRWCTTSGVSACRAGSGIIPAR